MKRAQIALALALLGAVSALCLKGMQKIGALLDKETDTEDLKMNDE